MAMAKISKECKIAGQRLSITCDAAGMQKIWKTRSPRSKNPRIVGTDRCSYPNPHGDDEDQVKKYRDRNEPGKHFTVDVSMFCGSIVPMSLTPSKLANKVNIVIHAYDVNSDEMEPRIGLKRMEELFGLEFDKSVRERGTENVFEMSSLGIPGESRYAGYEHFVARVPLLKGKRDAESLGNKIKNGIAALGKELSTNQRR